MMPLLLFFFLALVSSNHYSSTFTFNNFSFYEDNQNNLVQSSVFPEISNPLSLYCISQINFNGSFSLNLKPHLDLRPESK